MGALARYLETHDTVRNPPYRPLATIDREEAQRLRERIGGPENFASNVLQRMILADPKNEEYKKALASSIVSAEYAAIDAFGTKVARWEEGELPDYLMHAIVRQTWDEVRHAWLGTALIEKYGGYLGEYPDSLAGGNRRATAQQYAQGDSEDPTLPEPPPQSEQTAGPPPAPLDDQSPTTTLSRINIGIEGPALQLFSGVSKLGTRIGDPDMEQAYDFNWADEVLHVSIGDYFLKKLAEEDPAEERRALKVQAQVEMLRGVSERRTAGIIQEIKEFLVEEQDAAESALAGPLSMEARSSGY